METEVRKLRILLFEWIKKLLWLDNAADAFHKSIREYVCKIINKQWSTPIFHTLFFCCFLMGICIECITAFLDSQRVLTSISLFLPEWLMYVVPLSFQTFNIFEQF